MYKLLALPPIWSALRCAKIKNCKREKYCIYQHIINWLSARVKWKNKKTYTHTNKLFHTQSERSNINLNSTQIYSSTVHVSHSSQNRLTFEKRTGKKVTEKKIQHMSIFYFSHLKKNHFSLPHALFYRIGCFFYSCLNYTVPTYASTCAQIYNSFRDTISTYAWYTFSSIHSRRRFYFCCFLLLFVAFRSLLLPLIVLFMRDWTIVDVVPSSTSIQRVLGGCVSVSLIDRLAQI